MRKEQIELFKNNFCRILLSNGYSYQGLIKEIHDESLVFKDRYNGLMIIELCIIKTISEIGEEEDE